MSGKTFDLSSITTTIAQVPAADSTADVYTRDVLGDKSDTTATTGQAANTTFSLMRYMKGLWEALRSRAADLDFLHDASVIGSPIANSIGDLLNTLVTRVTNARATNLDNLDVTVSSRALSSTALSTTQWTNARAAQLDVLRYPVNTEVAHSGAINSSATQGTPGTYVQMIASLAHSVLSIDIHIHSTAGTTDTVDLDFSTGAGGSEVVRAQFRFLCALANAPETFHLEVDPAVFAKNTRVAVRLTNQGSNNARTIYAALSFRELND